MPCESDVRHSTTQLVAVVGGQWSVVSAKARNDDPGLFCVEIRDNLTKND